MDVEGARAELTAAMGAMREAAQEFAQMPSWAEECLEIEDQIRTLRNQLDVIGI